jgi:hypothetical protein
MTVMASTSAINLLIGEPANGAVDTACGFTNPSASVFTVPLLLVD